MADVKTHDLLWGKGQRPTRGPKPALGIDEIVRVGIEVADAEGLPAVTMRKVATELGFTTMALYRHIPGKHELVELMVDAALVGSLTPEVPDGWRAALTAWALDYFRIMGEHPWLLGAEAVGATFGPNRAAFMERGLRSLGSTGLPNPDKLGMLLTLTGYTHGAAQVYLSTALTAKARGVPESEFGTAFGEGLSEVIDHERFPAIASALSDGSFEDGEDDSMQDFLFGLERILDGIAVYVESAVGEDVTPGTSSEQPT